MSNGLMIFNNRVLGSVSEVFGDGRPTSFTIANAENINTTYELDMAINHSAKDELYFVSDNIAKTIRSVDAKNETEAAKLIHLISMAIECKGLAVAITKYGPNALIVYNSLTETA